SAGIFPLSLRIYRSAPGRCESHLRPNDRGRSARRSTGATRRCARHGRAPARDLLDLWPRRVPQGDRIFAPDFPERAREHLMSSPVDPVTRAVRAGLESDPTTGAVVPPIHLSSTFAFRAFGEKRGYDYTRSGNPTRDLLAEALAQLEGGVGGIVTATGMAAVTLVGYLLPAGSRIVAPHDCYGGTYRLFAAWQKRGELAVEFVDFADEAAVRRALASPTALLWIETPSNPLLRITDIARFAALGRERDALIVVDNTFLSPLWQRPIELGADLVVHSTTKYLNGHSDVVGGAVVARTEEHHRELAWWANCLGVTGAPFDSYMTLR